MDQQFVDLLRRFLLTVVPQTARRLRQLRRIAARIPDSKLRRQALDSIARKDFHVHGGSILATFLANSEANHFIELVAAFETAVDYLDNLCDRAGTADENDFRALHASLRDAIIPGAPLRAYFSHRERDDSGYLNELVLRSQRCFSALPGYDAIGPYVLEVTDRYCELQALKHLPPGVRERRCQPEFSNVSTGLQWWEGAAACGSTLPTFALVFGALQQCSAARARELFTAYFPRVSCFHILLDYFIDQAEDEKHGELNFVACYPDRVSASAGIARAGAQALEAARATSDPEHHLFAIRAMCGFYCTRPKVAQQHLRDDAAFIAEAVGIDLHGTVWQKGATSVLAPLLSLYSKMTRV